MSLPLTSSRPPRTTAERHCPAARGSHRAAMTSHVRAHRALALRGLLAAVLTVLALPTAALLAAPAHASGDPVVVDDQSIETVGEKGLLLYLKSSGGTDGNVVRWSTSGAPSWVDVQPNGYMTGYVPSAGGTFSFTITATSGTYSGVPVSQDSATFTIVAQPVPFEVGNSLSSDGTTIEVILGNKHKSRFGGPPMHKDSTWTSSTVPPGLTFTSDGRLEGVLTRAGSFPFTVTVEYHGMVKTKTFNIVSVSYLTLSTGPWGRNPSVVIGRPFKLHVRPIGHVGGVRTTFAGKRPAGYKLKRTSSTTYTLTGKVKTRKKVRVPMKVSDASGTTHKVTIVVKAVTAEEMGLK